MKLFNSAFDEQLTQERKKYPLLPAAPILVVAYTIIVAMVSLGVALLHGPVFLLIPWGVFAIIASIFYPRRVYVSMLLIALVFESIVVIYNGVFFVLTPISIGVIMSLIVSEVFHYLTLSRLKAAKIHQDTETKYRVLVEQANDGIVMVQNGKFIYVNKQFTCMLGYETDNLIQQSVKDIVNPEAYQLVQKILKINVADIGNHFSEIFQFQHKDGHLVDVEMNLSIVNYQGLPTIFGIARDITARQAAEAELKQTTLELNLLNTLNYAANQGLNLGEIFAILTKETRQLFSTHGATVLLFNDDKTHLLIHRNSRPLKTATERWIEKLVGINLSNINVALTPNSLYQQSLDSRSPTVFTNPDDIRQMMVEFAHSMLPQGDLLQKVLQKFLPQIFSRLEITSVLHLPLMTEDEIWGLLEFSGKTVDCFSPAQMAGLEGIAQQLAMIIKHTKVQNALVYSEALYVSLVENISLNIFRKDYAGHMTFANQNYCQTEGKSLDKILGKTDFDLHPPELAEKYRREDKQVMESGQPLEIIETHTPLGKPTIYVRTIKTPLYGTDGQAIGIQGVFEDITAQRENEVGLKHYAERLNMLRQIDQAILSSQSLEEVAQSALVPILDLIPAKRVSVVLFDEENDVGIILAVLGAEESGLVAGKKIPLNSYPPYIRYLNDPQATSYHFSPLSTFGIEQKLKKQGINASLNVKLTLHQKAMGTINIGFSDSDAISSEYQTIVEEVAASLSIALQQQMQANQIKTDAEIKTRLLQTSDHRVKNNLASIIGMLYLESRYATQNNRPINAETMKAMMTRVRGLSVLHEQLSTHQWMAISLRSLIAEILNTTWHQLLAGKKVVQIISPCDETISPETAQAITTAVIEIALNVTKYAIADRHTASLNVDIQKQNDTLRLTFHDDGPGYPAEVLETRKGFIGLDLINNSVKMALLGDVSYTNDAGAVTTIEFENTP